MSQALYRKWRPARFDQVIGQEHITRTLQNAVAAGRVGHAYLFCGPRGTGKTTLARLLAKAVNCLQEETERRPCDECANCQAFANGSYLDLIEVDAASNTGVDDIRDLREKINFSPGLGRFKVYIIDEVHMLSTAAFNALLKTLEEPPPHAMFVLATTEEHKVPLTIKSRCQQFNFRLLTITEIVGRLQWLARQESFSVEPEVLTMIARHAAGSLRDAESLLDQLVAAPGDLVTLDRAQRVLGTATSAAVIGLTDAWLTGDGPSGLKLIHEALASGVEPRQFARQMVGYLRQLLLLQAAGPSALPEAPADQQAEMVSQGQRAERRALIEALKRFNETAMTASGGWQPQLPLELAFIELLPATGSQAPPGSRPVASAGRQPAARPDQQAPATVGTVIFAEQGPAFSDQPLTLEAGTPASDSVPAVMPEEDGLAAPEAGPLTMIISRWPEIVARAREQDTTLHALLTSNCQPLAVDGTTLVLGFDHAPVKDRFDQKPLARQALGNVLAQLLNAKWSVRAVITTNYRRPVLPTASVLKEDFMAAAQELGGVVREV